MRTVFIILYFINSIWITEAQDVFIKKYSVDYQSNKISISPDNNIYLAGTGLDAGLIKTDSAGNKRWFKNYFRPNNGTQIYDILEYDNAVFIVGCTRDTILPIVTQNSNDLFFAKIDTSTGEIINSAIVGDSLNEAINRIIKTNDGNLIAIGSVETALFPSEYRPIILKFDTNLNFVWSKSFSTEKISVFKDIKESDDGNFYILGHEIEANNNESRIFLLKIDSLGNAIYSKYLFESGNQLYAQELELEGQSIMISGSYNTLGSNPSFSRFVAKLDTIGYINWFEVFNINTPINSGFFVKKYPNSFLMTAGKNIWVLDSSGFIISSNNLNENMMHGAISTSGNIYCADRFYMSMLKTSDSLSGCNQQPAVITQAFISTISDSTFQFLEFNYLPLIKGMMYQNDVIGYDSTFCMIAVYISHPNNQFVNDAFTITCSPNPNIGKWVVASTTDAKINSIKVTNAIGQEVYFKGNLSSQSELIDMGSLHKGFHFVTVSSTKGESDVVKVVVME